MKKLIVVLIFLAVITPVFAQSDTEETRDTYYRNFPVERIIPTVQGYIVQYRGQTQLRTVGIPASWFYESAGKADIVRLPGGQNWPTMTVFYADGEFSHVRLYTHRSRSHITWGNIPQGTDVSRFFPEGDSIDFLH